MILHHAHQLANRIATDLAPHCQVVRITGQLRRMRPDIDDIQIIAQPIDPDNNGPLTSAIAAYADPRTINWTNGLVKFKTQATPITVHIVRHPAQFGLVQMRTTGPALYWYRIHQTAINLGLRIEADAIWQGNAIIHTPEEADIYRLLDIDPIPAQERS